MKVAVEVQELDTWTHIYLGHNVATGTVGSEPISLLAGTTMLILHVGEGESRRAYGVKYADVVEELVRRDNLA